MCCLVTYVWWLSVLRYSSYSVQMGLINVPEPCHYSGWHKPAGWFRAMGHAEDSTWQGVLGVRHQFYAKPWQFVSWMPLNICTFLVFNEYKEIHCFKFLLMFCMWVCNMLVITLRLHVLESTVNGFNGSCYFKSLLKRQVGPLSVWRIWNMEMTHSGGAADKNISHFGQWDIKCI